MLCTPIHPPLKACRDSSWLSIHFPAPGHLRWEKCSGGRVHDRDAGGAGGGGCLSGAPLPSCLIRPGHPTSGGWNGGGSGAGGVPTLTCRRRWRRRTAPGTAQRRRLRPLPAPSRPGAACTRGSFCRAASSCGTGSAAGAGGCRRCPRGLTARRALQAKYRGAKVRDVRATMWHGAKQCPTADARPLGAWAAARAPPALQPHNRTPV